MNKIFALSALVAVAGFSSATGFSLVDFRAVDDLNNNVAVGETFTTTGNTHRVNFSSFNIQAPRSAIDVVWKFNFDTTITTNNSPASLPYNSVTQIVSGRVRRTSGSGLVQVDAGLTEQILNAGGTTVANNGQTFTFSNANGTTQDIPFTFSLTTAFSPLSQGQAQKNNLVIRSSANTEVIVDSITQNFQPVPEPASMLALAGGLVAFVGKRRRK